MCIHEITFQRDNEANGGIGCSMCNAERYRKTAMGIANALEREAERQAVEVEPHEFYGVSVEDVLREDVRDEYSTATEGHW